MLPLAPHAGWLRQESGEQTAGLRTHGHAQLGPGGSKRQWGDQMAMNHKQDRFPSAG